MTETETKVLEQLSHEPRTVKEVAAKANIGETTVRTTLKKLAGDDKVVAGSKGTWTLKAEAANSAAPTPPASKTKKAAPTTGRGTAAKANDAKVLETLKQHPKGLTRTEVAKESGVTERTYASIWRLSQAGKIKKAAEAREREAVWIAV